jgi:O-antigen ligase
MILAVVFSLSRMGFLCTLGSLFIVGTVSSTSNLSGKLGLRLKFLPAAAVGVVVLVAFVWLPTNDLVQRFATVGSGELRADARIRIWHETIPLIRESPWLGSGLGSYESTFLRYKKVAPMATVSHAHNDYLEALCELGVLGIAPLLILGGLSFSSAVRAACGPADVPERYLGVACLGALSAAFLHSWVDFNLHIPANAFMLAWLAGISLGLWPSSKFSSTASRKVLTKTRGLVPAIR